VLLILLGVVLVGAPLLVAVLMRRRVGTTGAHATRTSLLVAAGGAAAGVLATYLEHLVFGVTGLSIRATEVGVGGALLAMFLFSAPLGEAMKVGVIWPLYQSRRITRPASGLAFAVVAASGFASARLASALVVAPIDWLQLLRLALSIPAHLFFAGLWGYALGAGKARGRWFSLAWLSAMLLHGLYEHIVFGRGPGLLVAAAPLLAAMALVMWVLLRDVASAPESIPVSSRAGTLFPALPDPPSMGAVRRALSHADRPLLVHWIVLGTLVTLGVMIVALAAAVYIGHQVGLDFAVADEGDVRSIAPLVLLGVGFLTAFPVAGYLVARASAATSVLEPALAAGLALAAVVAFFSMAAPVSVVFALAVAPVAFALACGGAWFGLAR
jgi:hypothetical protein